MNYRCKVCENYCVCEYCKHFVPDEIEEYIGYCDFIEHKIEATNNAYCIYFNCMKCGYNE